MSQLLARAVANNVAWCSLISPGVSDTVTGIWTTLRPPAPFFPDAITTSPAVSATALQAATLGREPCAVKDSFADVDLSGDFRELFSARWVGRDGVIDPPRPAKWRLVDDTIALGTWCAAADLPYLSLPALLGSSHTRVLADWRDNTIVGGAVATFTHGVVGISNVFSTADDLPATWRAIVSATGRLWPGVHLVGYEHDEGLDAARGAGCTELGPLRIWQRERIGVSQ